MLCISIGHGLAQNLHLSDSNRLFIPQATYAFIHEDSSNLQYAIRDPGKFQSKQGRRYFPAYGLNEELWLSTSLSNRSAQARWYIVFDNPLLDKIHIYVLQDGRLIKDQRFGDRFKFSEKPIDSRSVVLPVDLEPGGDYQLLVNIDTDGRQTNPVFLIMTPEQFYQWELSRRTEFSLFFGFLILLVILTFYLSWIFSDSVFLWLSFFFFTLLFNAFCVSGLATKYLWPELPEVGQKIPGVIMYLNGICALGFCRAFISENTSRPIVNKLFNGFIIVLLILTLLSFGYGWVAYVVQLLLYRIIPFIYLLIFVTAAYSFGKRNHTTLFLILGMLVCIAAFIFWEFPRQHEVHVFNSTSTLLLFSTGCLFICFAAMDRLRVLKEYEKEHQLTQERERISRDLHDNIGTQLSLIASGLGRLPKDPSSKVEQLQQTMNATLVELRDTIWAINKNEVTLEEIEDKINSLFWRLRQNNESITYELNLVGVSGDQKLKPVQAINLFRIIQEAINNSQKHSGASKVTIQLQQENNMLYLTISDNGKGFDVEPSDQSEQYGLRNMKKRADEIHSPLMLTSTPGEGTHIRLMINLI